jgi:hypothetical protein
LAVGSLICGGFGGCNQEIKLQSKDENTFTFLSSVGLHIDRDNPAY